MSDFLAPGDINTDQLLKILKAAYLKPRIDEDGDLVITGHSGSGIFVILDADNHMYIRLIAALGFHDKVKRSDKLALANDMNNGVIFTRFSVGDNDTMLAEYYILFKEGITPLQIVSAVTFFEDITKAAIQEYDTRGLLA